MSIKDDRQGNTPLPQGPQEVELKLQLPHPQLAEKILQDPLIRELSRNTRPLLKEYETTYYDTRGHLLMNHRVCYRIRNSAGKYTATIKGLGVSQQGLSRRSEWERPLRENSPTLEPFQDLAIGQELVSIVKDQEILPVFVTRFKRTALDLICPNGGRIELALDMGEIEAAQQREPICELELELKSGPVENVLSLGKSLSEVYRLKPEERSKYQRGLRLAGLMSPSGPGITFQEINNHLLRDNKPSSFLIELSKAGILAAQYPFTLLEVLKDTPQSPQHHPEGSVWNHTLMVLDNAAGKRQASGNPQVLMWAALLHDLGKAPTTCLHKGRITSYGHDVEGEKLAVQFLRELTGDERFIHQVVKMVRWHMQILFVVKDLPFADVQKMTSEVSLEEIALLGFCDRLGRGGVTPEKKREEERLIEKFLARCREII